MANQVLTFSLIGTFVGTFGVILLAYLVHQIKFAIQVHKHNKEYRKKEKTVEEMKQKGEFHKWMSMNLFGKDILVCEKTGWCPDLKGFIKPEMIEHHKKNEELKEKFEEFKKERFKNICVKYTLSTKDLDNLLNDLEQLEIDFQTQEIEKLKENFEKKIKKSLKSPK